MMDKYSSYMAPNRLDRYRPASMNVSTGNPSQDEETRRVKSTEAIANCHIISCVQPREKNKKMRSLDEQSFDITQTRTVSILRIETPPPSLLFKVKYVSHIQHRSEFLSISSSFKFDIYSRIIQGQKFRVITLSALKFTCFIFVLFFSFQAFLWRQAATIFLQNVCTNLTQGLKNKKLMNYARKMYGEDSCRILSV